MTTHTPNRPSRHRRRSRIVGGALAATVGLAASVTATAAASTDPVPASATDAAREAVGTTFIRTELYFGSQKPDGTEVTEEQFDRFVDVVVTPRFPDGLTQLTGEGQFRGASGEAIEETAFVVILLYPLDDREANREIEQIRRAYLAAFDQESVLRADSRDSVSF